MRLPVPWPISLFSAERRGADEGLAALFSLVGLSCACESGGRVVARAVPTRTYPLTWERTNEASSDARAIPARAEYVPRGSSGGTRRARDPFGTALVGVLDFRNRIKGADSEAVDQSYFSNAVRAALKQRFPDMRIMTRENIPVLLSGMGKTLSDCEGECEVDTGRRLGADLVISGDLLKIGSHFKLDMRVHETREGQLINGATASGASPDELDQQTKQAVVRLLEPLEAR